MIKRFVKALPLQLCLMVVICIGTVQNAQAEKAVAELLRHYIESGTSTIDVSEDGERLIPVFLIYESRHYTPIWVRDTGPKRKAHDFLKILKASKKDALIPLNYRVDEIEKRIDSEDFQDMVELELLLSSALLDYGRDIHAGRIEPSKINKNIRIFPQVQGSATLLDRIELAHRVSEVFDTLPPQTPRYARLKQKLAEYRASAAKGKWQTVSEGEVLKPDMHDERVSELRLLLAQTGDLAPDAALPVSAEGAEDKTLYGPTLVEAVKQFQFRHGLDLDGVIGPDTLKQLNTPLSARIRQIELNMERRRWMQDSFGDFYVFVNLADQYLKVVKRNAKGREKTIHTAPLVVGKPYHATPVFTKKMTHMVMNPYWNVPSSITRNEYLPKLKRDPGAMQRQNIRIIRGWGDNAPIVDPYSIDWSKISKRNFPFRLRQDPGRKNALGKIKFMFPNKFNVYIHDTPSKSLFSRTSRFFSHGCMRVKDPSQLAEVLLNERSSGWNPKRISDVLGKGKKRVVRLKSFPVHVTYLTAWVNKNGQLHFRKDIYGRDKVLDRALKQSAFAGG